MWAAKAAGTPVQVAPKPANFNNRLARDAATVNVGRSPEKRSRALDLLAEAKGDLERAAELPENRVGVDRLRGLSETLDRTLREDRAKIERLWKERAEAESRQLRQDRGQDLGFSM